MQQLFYAPSLPGLGHLGREYKLLTLEARQTVKGRRRQAMWVTSNSGSPRAGALCWAPTLPWKAAYSLMGPLSWGSNLTGASRNWCS